MDSLRLWGFSLIGVCVFRLLMTPPVGVHPDSINLTITLNALALGGCLCVVASATQSTRGD